MTIAGIIAEYNPLHYGHSLLIKQLKENCADFVAVVMSGNFVQRGDAAILSKWARTKQALLCGADLVLELPLPWAVAGAERFAFGGVSILSELGADIIGFGSECGNIDLLKQAEKALISPQLKDALRSSLDSGKTFAAARQQAVCSLFGAETASLLSEPNNILGIEYLKAIECLNSSLKPYTIKRVGSAHNDSESINSTVSSAKIRSLVSAGKNFSDYMPKPAYHILKSEIESGNAPANILYLERGILAKLRTMERLDFSKLPDISEGLENRVYEAVQKAKSLNELYQLIKSKRYTLARIRRMILSAYLGLNSDYCEGTPPYIRILGIGKGGAEILRTAKQTSKVPIISRHADTGFLSVYAKKILELENRTTDLYSLCMPHPACCGLDNTNKIIVL